MKTQNAFRVRAILAIAVVASALLGSAAAQASILTFDANLDGLQVVPPNAGPAFGFAEITLDDTSGALTVTSGSYQNLLGNSFAVGLYDAAAGSNGPLVSALTNDTPGATTGTFSGSATLTGGQIADTIADKLYVKVSSSVFPAGEIRGQFTAVPEPGTVILSLIAACGALLVGRRWRRAA